MEISEMKSVLKSLCEKSGVSGDELSVSFLAADMLKKYTDDVSVDSFGNVVGYISSGKDGAETLMLDAHIDRVGLIVTYIDDSGFLSVGACGSPDVKTLSAQSVTVHGRRGIKGVVSTLPPHVKAQNNNSAPEIDNIRIDVGMTKKQAEEVISLGDRITVNSEFIELGGSGNIASIVTSAAVDDRSGICAVLAALDLLKDKELSYDLAVCFTAQEETGERGAKQTAFRIQPDKAIAVDVSFGRTPDSDPKETAELGSGVMIGFSAALDTDMSNSLKALAVKSGIPFTCEIMPSSTGTNADAIGVSGRGVKCCTLSFPIRYMHTSIETVDLKDVAATAELICEYVCKGGNSDD